MLTVAAGTDTTDETPPFRSAAASVSEPGYEASSAISAWSSRGSVLGSGITTHRSALESGEATPSRRLPHQPLLRRLCHRPFRKPNRRRRQRLTPWTRQRPTIKWPSVTSLYNVRSPSSNNS